MFDPATEEVFLGIAHALFMNRLHVLRLTEGAVQSNRRVTIMR